MKKLICFIFLILTNLFINANTLPNKNVGDSTLQQQKHLQQKQQITEIKTDNIDYVSSITLAVNSINNIISWTSATIAIYTLVIALFGFFGYRHIKERIDENLEKNRLIIDDKINEINKKEQIYDDIISQTQVIINKIDVQDKYMCQTNENLYDALNKLANQIPDEKTGKHILKEMLHNYQITNLFSSYSTKHFAGLAYLQENGTIEDIVHLESYLKHCIDEKNKIWAREIIGVIKQKYAQ